MEIAAHSLRPGRHLGFNGLYDLVHARELEGRDWREDVGVRLISAHRSRKGWGRVPASSWSVTTANWPPRGLPSGLDEWARPFRRHHYYPAHSLDEVMVALNAGADVQIRVPLTRQWDRAYLGAIDMPSASSPIDGREHAVLLEKFDPERKTFLFPNSWGDQWGNDGWGELPQDYVRQYSEIWVSPGLPSDLLWKLALGPRELLQKSGEDMQSIRARLGDSPVLRLIESAQVKVLEARRQFAEVQTTLPTLWGSRLFICEWWDLSTNADVAWAFSVEREGILEVEELFVMPAYRGEGYGRRLLQSIAGHAASTGLPWRWWVSHADVARLGASIQDVAWRLGLDWDAVETPWFGKCLTPRPGRVQLPKIED